MRKSNATLILGFLTAGALALAAISLVSCQSPAERPSGPLRIDVLYMNHGPVQPTLQAMRELFARYGEKIQVSWHDVETEDGASFMTKRNVQGHVPLAIFFDDKDTVPVGEATVKFSGFPAGAGPLFAQGKWTLEDVRAAIDRMTAGR